MADTITINGTTYHKLITFKDCAAKTDLYGNKIPGAGDYLPWAFVDYDKNLDKSENSIQTFAPRYFTQKITTKCISYKMLENTPAGCKDEDLYKTGQTFDQKNYYYKLLCKKDIKYGNSSTSFDYGLSNSSDGAHIGWDKRICTYFGEGNDPSSNHMYSATSLTNHDGVNNSWSDSWSQGFQPPSNKDSYFKYGVYKTSGSTTGKFAVAIRVTSGVAYEEVKKHIIRWPGIIEAEGNPPTYRGVNIYNNDGSPIANAGVNYALFWNICKTAQLNDKKIGLYMSVTH